MFNTLDEIKAANAQHGHHFFSPGATRFFNSRASQRIYPRADGSAYFVTSEQQRGCPRRYTVRLALANGECGTAPGTKLQAFATGAAAHAWAAEALAKEAA